jgi:RNA polymerase sigma-70 factor (ECF subfamily)
MAKADDQRDTQYRLASAEFGSALARLARAYEPDLDRRRDLLQDIHLELWRSFAAYQEQCSLRTWVYRVAHNVGISRRIRKRKLRLVSLDDADEIQSTDNTAEQVDAAHDVVRLYALIRQLESPDDQVMLLYLEDMDAAAIGEVTGLSANAVAIRIHRIKLLLARKFA